MSETLNDFDTAGLLSPNPPVPPSAQQHARQRSPCYAPVFAASAFDGSMALNDLSATGLLSFHSSLPRSPCYDQQHARPQSPCYAPVFASSAFDGSGRLVDQRCTSHNMAPMLTRHTIDETPPAQKDSQNSSY